MPNGTFVDLPPEKQAQMLAALRCARYGYLLALQVLLLCAAGRTPAAIAAYLFCSRSSVYRTVCKYENMQTYYSLVHLWYCHREDFLT
jgi:Homeodomain-like domain